MNVLEYLKENILYLDGGMGTLLQAKGLVAGEHPERWNLTHADDVTAIHRAYYDAGSNVVSANTFGANALKFSPAELEEIVAAAMENVRRAQKESSGTQAKFAALDIGPLGKLLKPYGDLDFEGAVSIFAQTVRLGVKYGADLVLIETMNDSYETKAALLAVKENCSLPVFVSNAYGEDGKLMTGADPAAMVTMLEGMGADAIGVNCSLGPEALRGVVEKYLSLASIPVLMKPNAGLPVMKDGATYYDVDAASFAKSVASLMEQGVRVAGGCCGTTPAYIAALTKETAALAPKKIEKKNTTCVSSYTHAVTFDRSPILIGERINPTGKKRFKQALVEHDIGYILNEGIRQQEKGVQILDVNVGLPDIDEPALLCEAMEELQAVLDLPLQIDTADAVAMEKALRRYNGKALVNSVSGKEESMEAIFPLVKKYGGTVIALTLDENGIPETAEGRVAIAEKILARAAEYGIEKKDIIFDTLAMTVSAAPGAAKVTLEALHMIRKDLGCHTSLGVSNVSFGLPNRGDLNSTFFA
ncbi:MAG: homocysteine S-methyltransferase family protein, partial [Oscillospiraceae bacterium]|nr:homocysteine S-methyltransferase family protein [Oscillospiraceae bacterium]